MYFDFINIIRFYQISTTSFITKINCDMRGHLMRGLTVLDWDFFKSKNDHEDQILLQKFP